MTPGPRRPGRWEETMFTVCHMFVSLDGKIDGDFFAAPEAAPALAAYGALREDYRC